MSRRAIPARRGRAAAESSGAEAQALLARTARQQERVEELELELAQSKVHLAHTSPMPRPCTSPPHLPTSPPHLPIAQVPMLKDMFIKEHEEALKATKKVSFS